MGKEILKMENISKSFPGVKALDKVDFPIYQGEVMGFLGENGAGKSTLMKILSGVYKKDEGKIFLEGKDVEFSGPKDAMDQGIAIIHQELNLIDGLAVYENIFLGREIIGPGGKLNKEEMIGQAQEILDSLHTHINPKSKVYKLSLAQQQMVEVAKALSLNAKVIIMDEPTDALTSREVESLFEVIKKLKDQGKGIVYISHRLEEIEQICDRYTVLRDGQFIGTKFVNESNEAEMVSMMVGRSLDDQVPYLHTDNEGIALEVKDLSNKHVDKVSFSIRHGEILGIAGLVGAGRTELAKTLYGHYPYDSGEISLHGKKLSLKSAKDGIKNGIVYVSEDRKEDGLILGMDVRSNMTLASLNQFIKMGKIDQDKEKELAQSYVDSMNVRTPSLNQATENLSGGNQQKISIARSLMTKPEILILDEPTRGVDVGAKYEIYTLLNQIKNEGKAILLISSDMAELLGIADRILVMADGSIVGELSRAEASQEKIMEMIIQGQKTQV